MNFRIDDQTLLSHQWGMNWCAIDSSSPQISLATGCHSNLLQEVQKEGNASQLLPRLFQELPLNLEKIDHWIINQGPGSYNGLRVGFAFLKGMLFADARPVIAIPSSLSMALAALSQAPSARDLLVIHNARRDEIHATPITFKNDIPIQGENWIGPASQLKARLPRLPHAILSFDFTQETAPCLSEIPWLKVFPSARFTAQAAQLLKLPPIPHLPSLEPHYVRPPVPEKQSK